MELMGAISEGEWSSLGGMYTAEEADFTAHLLNNSSIPNDLNWGSSLGLLSTFWPAHGSNKDMAGPSEGSYYPLDIGNSNSRQQTYRSFYSHPILVSDMVDLQNTSSFLIEGDECLSKESSEGSAEKYAGSLPGAAPAKSSQIERESEMPIPESIWESKFNNSSEDSKKRSRSSGDVQKNKRIEKLKKNQKLASTGSDVEDVNVGVNRQSTSSCSSEDDQFNASQEQNGGETSSLNTKGPASLNNGKTRASRGSATDPQSLYARKRREKINERLRILQNLVPNGTKVDISTMLEEAVQYVKFLQLQIKFLSSDDTWMYAPIAYNGMNVGLDLNITPLRQS